jgi:hypothetical protein
MTPMTDAIKGPIITVIKLIKRLASRMFCDTLYFSDIATGAIPIIFTITLRIMKPRVDPIVPQIMYALALFISFAKYRVIINAINITTKNAANMGRMKKYGILNPLIV